MVTGVTTVTVEETTYTTYCPLTTTITETDIEWVTETITKDHKVMTLVKAVPKSSLKARELIESQNKAGRNESAFLVIFLVILAMF